MKIINDITTWRRWRDKIENQSIGFVPTMGNLHQGHASLLQHSANENEKTILSIFINPTQFNNKDDFNHYPHTIEQDLQVAERYGVDCVFMPPYEEIYADDYRYQVSENHLSQTLCGQHRSGHFTGVLTVVLKLLLLVKPHKLYLGKKDFQQWQLIQGMVKSFFLDVDVVPCPIIRENDQLAMSSRNNRLTTEQRQLAAHFPRLLHSAQSDTMIRQQLEQQGFIVDYIETHHGRRFGAVHLGDIRLIDNVKLNHQSEEKDETLS